MLISEFATRVLEHVGEPAGRPAIVAVDGRSAGGKSTLAGRLAAEIPGTVIVHTDDIAWWHAVLDWADLLVEGVLEPVRRGESVSYRPPKWDERDREGSIDVPAGTRLLIVEGVGAGRRELAARLDGVIWVDTPLEVTQSRDEVRIAAGETTRELYDLWMVEENPFVEEQRTWERAFLVVDGTAGDEIVLRGPGEPGPAEQRPHRSWSN